MKRLAVPVRPLLVTLLLAACGAGDDPKTLDGLAHGSANTPMTASVAAQAFSFSANRAAYALTATAAGLQVSDLAGGDGTSEVPAPARLHFADVSVGLDAAGIPGQAYRVYQAAFNRTPDSSGVGFWIAKMDQGMTLEQVAAGFVTSPEFKAMYGTNPDNLTLVSRFYRNVLGRDGEPAGIAFWTDVLNTNRGTVAQVLMGFSESIENKNRVAPAIASGFPYTRYLDAPLGEGAPLAARLATLSTLLAAAPPYSRGTNAARSRLVEEMDSILWSQDAFQPTATAVTDYYTARVNKVLAELQQPVPSGIRIWNLYSHSFIVKTPSKVFAFDLVSGKADWNSPAWPNRVPDALINAIDVLFISHEHGDHYDYANDVPVRVKARGKPVVYPAAASAKNGATLLVNPNDVFTVAGLNVKALYGFHSVPNLAYEVTTPEGYRVMHTGDTTFTDNLPANDNIDVLLVNVWLDTTAERPSTVSMRNVAAKVKPSLMIPGHIFEMAHPKMDPNGSYGFGVFRYRPVLPVQDESPIGPTNFVVLTWGESVTFRK